MSEDLTDEQISELGQDLRSALSELEALLAAPSDRAEIVDLDQPIGRLSRMDAMQQQKMAAEQLRRHKLKRSLVRRALTAIDDEEYGTCRQCEEPIGYRRLKARPESPFCLECMDSIEARRR